MYKNKSKLKESKAITLIALVITIVVLIILAGVAINLTLSQNGIFNKASEGKDKYEIAAIKERVELELTALEMENIDKDPVTIETALIELSKKKIFDSIDVQKNVGVIEEYEVTLKSNEKGEIEVEKIGKVEEKTEIKLDLQNTEYTGDTNYLTKDEDGSITISAPSGWDVKWVYINDIDFSKYSKISITYSYVAGYDWALYLHTVEDEAKDYSTVVIRESNKYESLEKTTTICDIPKNKNYSRLALVSSSLNAKLTIYDITLIK